MAGKSIRSPLARAQGLGSAKEGTTHWWMARVTSVALAPLCFYLLGHACVFLPPPERLEDLARLISSPLMELVLVMSIVVGIYHAALGVEVILEDYVHGKIWKLGSLILNKIFFLALGAAAVYALAMIDFAQAGK